MLKLRHDHSSNDMPQDFRQELIFLAPSGLPLVQEPENRGRAERFNPKETLLWI